ncbi:MAG: hypothetical protein AB7P37_10650 [Ramlibacter sp.]
MLDRDELETWAQYKARFDSLDARRIPRSPADELSYQHYVALTARLQAFRSGVADRRPERSLARTPIMSLTEYLRGTRRRVTELAKPHLNREPQSRGKTLVHLDMLMYQFKAHFCQAPRINEVMENDAKKGGRSAERSINTLLICYCGLLRDMHEVCTAYILNHENEREEGGDIHAYSSPGMAAVALAFHKPVTRLNDRLNTVGKLKDQIAAALREAAAVVNDSRPNLLVLYPAGGEAELTEVRTTPHSFASVSMDVERQQQTGHWYSCNVAGKHYLNGEIPPLDRSRYLSQAAAG